jgi:hypothetical protein
VSVDGSYGPVGLRGAHSTRALGSFIMLAQCSGRSRNYMEQEIQESAIFVKMETAYSRGARKLQLAEDAFSASTLASLGHRTIVTPQS